ncbi:hypothetical protein AB0K34_04935 [Actinomadura sp. NPDC049382]|uniref:VG15 protein n=1 Tax=Actinomadura sp. NPDC049382 TaxID=3158220 RepID=UPI003420FDF9
MPTAAEVAAYAAQQDDVVALAHADLVRWWAELDTSDGRTAAAALEAFMADLVAAYGSVAASLAADFYDDLREQADAPRRFRAHVADPVPAEQVGAAARWAAGPMFGGDGPNAALEHAAGAVQRLVQQPGRETIELNTRRDPARPGWARVPRGKGCAFCRMLAGRGAVYSSARAAGDMRAFHDHCKCSAVPVWRGQGLPYDADALEREYLRARENAGGGSPKAVLAQMREDLGVR